MKKNFIFVVAFIFSVPSFAQVAAGVAAGAAAGAAGGSWMPVIGTIAGAVLGGSIAAFGSWLTGKKSADSAEKLNAENLAFQKQQAEYQKFLNSNQFQIMSSDARKAGINPIAMTGGNVQSSSFSGSSAEPDYSGYASSLGQIGSSIINNSANLYSQHKQIQADKDMQNQSISSQEAMHSDSIRSEEKIAQDNNETAKEIERIKQQGENQRNQAIIAQQVQAMKSAEKIANAKIKNEADLAEKARKMQEYLATLGQWASDANQRNQIEYLTNQLDEIKRENSFNDKMTIWDRCIRTYEAVTSSITNFMGLSSKGSASPYTK